MKYKYQMHTHTSPCSACASATPDELVYSLYKGGYNGCVLTNHFIRGNSGIDPNLSWNDFVYQYENDYIECKKAAEKYNIDIIFGVEENVGDGLEILCYGITPRFLYDNPQLQTDHSVESWYNALHKFGALCIQAHPFRDRAYIKNPRVLPIEYIDGIEVYNHFNSPENNLFAEQFADEHPDLILTSGADTHNGVSSCFAGIMTDIRITDEKDIVTVLKSRNYILIK